MEVGFAPSIHLTSKPVWDSLLLKPMSSKHLAELDSLRRKLNYNIQIKKLCKLPTHWETMTLVKYIQSNSMSAIFLLTVCRLVTVLWSFDTNKCQDQKSNQRNYSSKVCQVMLVKSLIPITLNIYQFH